MGSLDGVHRSDGSLYMLVTAVSISETREMRSHRIILRGLTCRDAEA